MEHKGVQRRCRHIHVSVDMQLIKQWGLHKDILKMHSQMPGLASKQVLQEELPDGNSFHFLTRIWPRRKNESTHFLVSSTVIRHCYCWRMCSIAVHFFDIECQQNRISSNLTRIAFNSNQRF